MTRWIVDASPLIFLAKLGRLDLLRRSATEVLLPAAVLEEIRRLPDEASASVEEALGTWLRVGVARDRSAVEFLELDLGPGEAEAIALAREMRAERIVLTIRMPDGSPGGWGSSLSGLSASCWRLGCGES